jgi:hypothetical protein
MTKYATISCAREQHECHLFSGQVCPGLSLNTRALIVYYLMLICVHIFSHNCDGSDRFEDVVAQEIA